MLIIMQMYDVFSPKFFSLCFQVLEFICDTQYFLSVRQCLDTVQFCWVESLLFLNYSE